MTKSTPSNLVLLYWKMREDSAIKRGCPRDAFLFERRSEKVGNGFEFS